MYYILEDRDVTGQAMRFQGVPFDAKQNEIQNTIFNPGNSLAGSLNQPISVILTEKNSRVNGKKITDRIPIQMAGIGFTNLYSPEVKSFFEEIELPNLEFIETVIKGRHIFLDTYFLMNITKKVACLNRDETEAEYFEDGTLWIIDRLSIEESSIPKDLEIFLLEEVSDPMIIVSEKLKNKIIEKKMTGFVFTKPEDYSSF